MKDDLDREVERHNRRRIRFIKEGLKEQEAWDLAESMFDRDRDPFDDRRLCFECEHHAGRLCTKITDRAGKPTPQLRFMLQRCEHFELLGSK